MKDNIITDSQELLQNLKLAHGETSRGGRGIISYCPFGTHDNPDTGLSNSRSFSVSFEKGVCTCFSCGRGMSVARFLISRGLDIQTANYWQSISGTYGSSHSSETTVNPINNNNFAPLRLGSQLPDYFIYERGFKTTTMKHFGVGYNPHTETYTIPLFFEGEIEGAAYRTLGQDAKIKYSYGFDRTEFIYNFAPTEERIYVEGFTDVFRIFENGSINVSSLLGTVFSQAQVDIMKSSHKKIYLAYDIDLVLQDNNLGAGITAMFRLYEQLRDSTELQVFVIPVLPFDEKINYCKKYDAEMLNKEQWQMCLGIAKTMLRFQLDIQKKFPWAWKNYKNNKK